MTKPLYTDQAIYECMRRHGVTGAKDQADTLNGANIAKAMLELRSFYEGKLADLKVSISSSESGAKLSDD